MCAGTLEATPHWQPVRDPAAGRRSAPAVLAGSGSAVTTFSNMVSYAFLFLHLSY
jgi:hypothetical protein